MRAFKIGLAGLALLAGNAFAASLGNQDLSCSAALPNNTVSLSGNVGDTFTVTNTSNTNACGGVASSNPTALSWVLGTTGVNNTFGPQYVGGTIAGPNSNVDTVTLNQAGTYTFTVTSNFTGTTTYSVTIAGAAANTATVPTLSEYAMIALASLMAMGGFWTMRKRAKI